ncbi:RDD family protein [Streptomyces fungicidicus]|uniref:RDD family protein n=1 Tax=Streptomyces fungicidicus TaxID=68203 RepID=UPI0038134136
MGGVIVGYATTVNTPGSPGPGGQQSVPPAFWAASVVAVLAVSFTNQVLFTLVARASLGKLATGLRVIRTSDEGRAGFVRLVGRWLFGFFWSIVFVPLHLATDSNVEQQDAVGLRIVRRTVRS